MTLRLSSVKEKFLTLFGILTKKEKTSLIAMLSFLLIESILSIFNITPFNPNLVDLNNRLLPPSFRNIFGTDNLGRDVLSRVIKGFSTSVGLALLSVIIALVIAVSLGLASAYIGGLLDRMLAIIMDSFYVMPGLILAMLLALLLRGVLPIVFAISVPLIPSIYRVTRSMTLSIKERLFIEACKVSGVSKMRILFGHILNHVKNSVIVLTILNLGDAILMVASLGFLGLGINPPTPEWGTDLSVAREFVTTGAWWIAFFPGLAIVVNVFVFLSFSELLTKVLNPKTREIL